MRHSIIVLFTAIALFTVSLSWSQSSGQVSAPILQAVAAPELKVRIPFASLTSFVFKAPIYSAASSIDASHGLAMAFDKETLRVTASVEAVINVTTKDGNTYMLRVIPDKTVTQSLFYLVEVGGGNAAGGTSSAGNTSPGSSVSSRGGFIDLLIAMYNFDPIENFMVQQINNLLPEIYVINNKTLEMAKAFEYLSPNIIGETWLVSVKSDAMLEVKESDFVGFFTKPNTRVRAILLDAYTLERGTYTKLIVIYEKLSGGER